MSNKKMTLFISDIHMGPGEKWDWFDAAKEGPKLIKFFEYVTKRYSTRRDIKEIVLLGDVFDLWVCPHDKTPHTFLDICNSQKMVIDSIKEMAEKVPVLYVNGNHDYQVGADDIKNAFDGRVKYLGQRYQRGNILAIHGHQHALFNRPDPKNGGPTLRIPLGYYITRMYTTLGKSRKSKANLMFQVIDESFQVLGPEKLPESVLDVLKDAILCSKDIDVKTFNMGHICREQSFDDVRDRYQNLYDDWLKAVGFWQSVQMIMCELNRLGTIADQLCRDGIEIVVMGHSHDTKTDKDHLIGRDRIYANCGYWCGFDEEESGEDNAHFVQTDGEKVELCSFRQGKSKKEEILKL